ncbi:hypothetical protein [Affinirhizobium pseudoryzae]|nr:hypothetical protein [Allorhizobium pseudoryzae]
MSAAIRGKGSLLVGNPGCLGDVVGPGPRAEIQAAAAGRLSKVSVS